MGSGESAESRNDQRALNRLPALRNNLDGSVRRSQDGMRFDRRTDSETCGRQQIAPEFDERIFGGSHAVPHSWPWVSVTRIETIQKIGFSFVFHVQQVAFGQKATCDDGSDGCVGLCGGTLLNERYVLTASHCLNSDDPTKILIIAGIHDKQLVEEASRRQKVQVKAITMHPGWDPETLDNDIAILELAEPVTFNEYVQPVCLPGPTAEPDSSVILIGWGKVETGGAPYHILKQVKVEVIDNCKRFWDMNPDKQICVGDPVTGSAACQGDSGGSALQEHDGQWYIEGVTSYGPAACSHHANGAPAVYARVSAYVPWIKSIIDE